MLRLLLLLLLALPLSVQAAITTTTCTSTVQTGCIVVPLYQYSQARGVAVQVSGTWVGEVQFEVSNESGSSAAWLPVLASPSQGGPYVTSTTANGMWNVCTGASYFRVRASSLSSGSITATPQPTGSCVAADVVSVTPSADGGLQVTLAGERVAAEVTGLAGGDVAIAGTVDLGTTTLANLNPVRTRRDWRGMPVDGGSPTAVPYAFADGGMPPLTDRTEVSISYAQNGGTARCGCPEIGDPLPSCDAAPSRYAGKTLSAGVTVTWSELKTGTTCYCVGCGLTGTDTRQIEVLEGGNAP